jgi:hypothetical protein
VLAVRALAELDVSAASGLVRVGAHLFVVADDEVFLDAYAAGAPHARVARIPLPDRAPLPDGAERKRAKPDLESLALLPDGRLLALASGSTERRRAAYLFDAPGRDGLPTRAAARSLSPLYESLGARFPELNIEGAAVSGDRIRLLQRGNGRTGENAVIDLDLSRTLRALDRGEALTGDLVRSVLPVDLGALHGVRLGFTDASPIEEGSPHLAFAAAAEDTDDPYLDGRCTGSVLGVLDAAGRIAWCEALEGEWKIEGLTLAADGTMLLVADPDDRAARAPLLALRAPWPRSIVG